IFGQQPAVAISCIDHGWERGLILTSCTVTKIKIGIMKINKEINRLMRNVHNLNIRIIDVKLGSGVKVTISHENTESIIHIHDKKLIHKIMISGFFGDKWRTKKLHRKQVKKYLKSLPFSEYERLIKGD
ncbi:MAG: hypothetical protein KAS32_17295, partial [Candidatus Peribacteraceae bacterium]|nr:hypothetical protein [Candidatus Peribacteraceae bacterium]